MSHYSILIVDDEPNQRLMLEQALRSLATDCTITTAASGQEALDAMERRAPNLLITDYNMPAMNGLELIVRMRGGHIASRIIMITAYSTPELYAIVRHHSIDHYLTKPVSLALLRNLATTMLAARID
jgi:CheY-like chemotaxis protein